MKSESTSTISRKGTRSGLWIIFVAAALLELITCIMYFTSRAAIRMEAEQRAQTELRRAELEIEVHAIETETAAKALAKLAEKQVDQPDSVLAATRLAVQTLRANTSMAVAYVPDYFKGERLKVTGERIGSFFEACSSRFSEDSIYTRQIGSAAHDYTQMEWWQNGFKHDSCWWCEPYLDDSGSQTYVVSCSYPVRDGKGKVVAVVCVDLSLSDLKNLSEYLQVYPNSYYSIRSSTGVDIVPVPDTVAGRKYNIFREEVDATGWHLEIIIPEEELFRDLNHTGLIVTILMLVGLVMLVLIMWYAGANNKRLIESISRNQSMENELNIARQIQMAMLPNRFPPFPDYPNLNAYGEVIPAKEVGGDLYDFYIREGRLFFCVGDVSGKGVPASIVMAMTRSLFRSFSCYMDSPAQIVKQMNESLSGEGNDQSMFVTLFLGVLDLSTGELQYCNAGHNAPIQIKNEKLKIKNSEILSCVPNLPLGVLAGFEFKEQETKVAFGDTLFLYTDGLTEAENSDHAQFGEERMMSIVESQKSKVESPQELIAAMQQAVAEFVGSAEQSDDLTMFAIRLIDKSPVTNHPSPLTSGRYSLVMRNDIQQIPTLAEWIEMIGLPEELNMPINLALEEAVSNVMLYAYPGKSGQVLIECTKSDKLVFTISDSGIPFDPTQQEDPDVTQSVDERPIGGLGIYLVRQIMDDIRYERKNEKNILTLTKTLNH
ncbi:MAG: SpoIIE family protein phosphatase [Paludibacteraceae bacterium]|nr:SpoIIE family protein phosphatase [Paludibacteraceae bacterium]